MCKFFSLRKKKKKIIKNNEGSLYIFKNLKRVLLCKERKKEKKRKKERKKEMFKSDKVDSV